MLVTRLIGRQTHQFQRRATGCSLAVRINVSKWVGDTPDKKGVETSMLMSWLAGAAARRTPMGSLLLLLPLLMGVLIAGLSTAGVHRVKQAHQNTTASCFSGRVRTGL